MYFQFIALSIMVYYGFSMKLLITYSDLIFKVELVWLVNSSFEQRFSRSFFEISAASFFCLNSKGERIPEELFSFNLSTTLSISLLNSFNFSKFSDNAAGRLECIFFKELE